MLEKINYEDVAGQVNMSGYNFHRTFNFMAGYDVPTNIFGRPQAVADRTGPAATGQRLLIPPK